MSDFEASVRRVVLSLRAGDVVTYGEVAQESGHSGAARAVGGVMASSEGLPWWRVVNSNGRLVPGHEAEQARRLRKEGVEVDGRHVRAFRSTRGGRRSRGTMR